MKELREYKDEAREEVFRLEYRQSYHVASDLEEFEKWRRGESTAADNPENGYFQALRSLRDRGVRAVRVRIVDFPVSEYLLYELDFYRQSASNGEDIRLLERALAIDCMQSTVESQDFWLFDSSVVLIWKYTDEGERDGQKEIRDPAAASHFVGLRDCLLTHAMLIDQFVERYSDSFAAARESSRPLPPTPR